jgi:PiT family inorganic phosphate transporter
MLFLLFISVCFLSFANGANDNFKGVATLYGSGAASYRVALFWATLTTLVGSFCALYLAQSLLLKFSGKGLTTDALVQSVPFMTAVALGAGLTVILATRIGFPISTTHALIGAMVGSGLIATWGNLDLTALQHNFVLPLLLSPPIAILLAMLIYKGLKQVRLWANLEKELCLCVERETVGTIESGAVAMTQSSHVLLNIDTEEACDTKYSGKVLGIHVQSILDKLHFFSAGAVCFARGLNDTPKIAALLLLAPWPGIHWVIFSVAIIMALGGLLSARRVAETMSHKITEISHGQGLAANISTAILVIYASKLGMPVSTTHVSVGSLFGIGVVNGNADKGMIGTILLSWVLTLPCAALCAAFVYGISTYLS